MPKANEDTGGGFVRRTKNLHLRLVSVASGTLCESHPQTHSSHQRSFHHPVSLSFLTVFVPVSSSITHPQLEGIVESKSKFAVAASSKPLRTPAQADVTLDSGLQRPRSFQTHTFSSPPSLKPFAIKRAAGLAALFTANSLSRVLVCGYP
jgi:hypothetical protein